MTSWTCDKRVDKSGNVDYRLIATCHELFGPSTSLAICFYCFAFLWSTGFYVLCTVDWIFWKEFLYSIPVYGQTTVKGNVTDAATGEGLPDDWFQFIYSFETVY